jgi:hypothetical protein
VTSNTVLLCTNKYCSVLRSHMVTHVVLWMHRQQPVFPVCTPLCPPLDLKSEEPPQAPEPIACTSRDCAGAICYLGSMDMTQPADGSCGGMKGGALESTCMCVSQQF